MFFIQSYYEYHNKVIILIFVLLPEALAGFNLLFLHPRKAVYNTMRSITIKHIEIILNGLFQHFFHMICICSEIDIFSNIIQKQRIGKLNKNIHKFEYLFLVLFNFSLKRY